MNSEAAPNLSTFYPLLAGSFALARPSLLIIVSMFKLPFLLRFDPF